MSVKIDFTLSFSGEDSIKVYRSTSPMDPESLPTALDTLTSGTRTYTDSSVSNGVTYYYRFSAIIGASELVGDEVSVNHDLSNFPDIPINKTIIGLPVTDLTHASTDNVISVLESAGFTQELIYPLIAVGELPGDTDFDIYMFPRTYSTSASTDWDNYAETAWAAGVPMVFGSGGSWSIGVISSHPSTWADITGTLDSDGPGYQIDLTNNTHYITKNFSLGLMDVSPSGSKSYQVALATGESHVGTILAEGDPGHTDTANRPVLIAVESGINDLDAVATPSRSVFYGHFYYGQGLATTNGESLITRIVEWATTPGLT